MIAAWTWPKMRIRIAFTLASLTHAAGQNVIYLLAFRYFTDNLAMAASWAGMLFASVKIYDGILDPVLGAVSDRTRTRIGRRLPYLLAGSILMPLAIVLLFAAPVGLQPVPLWLFAAVVLMLHASAYTALTVPGMAMVVEVTDDFHERSTLMSYRVIGNQFGTLAGTTLPAWLLVQSGPTRTGHLEAALAVAVIVLLAGVVATALLLHAPRTVPAQDPPRFKLSDIGAQVRLAWNNRPFRQLAVAHIFVLIGTMTATVSNAHFTRYVLKRSDDWLGKFPVYMTIGVVATMPIWLIAARKFGKKRCYGAAALGYGAFHLSWITAGPGEPYSLMVLRGLLTGVAAAGLILFAYSMMSDAIRYDYIHTGLRREGSFAGFTSLLDKLAAAGGAAAFGVLLGTMGYQASSSAGQLVQSDSAILAINLGFTVIPALSMLCCFWALSGYKLEAADLVEPAAPPTTPPTAPPITPAAASAAATTP